jgi:hypothetical protein
MANWITHLRIVDELYNTGLDLDERGFAIGNIAPDCNIENEDWTRFTPPRETTHWMNGESKLTADYEGFYQKYIEGGNFLSREHKAFLWGYYSHLVTDVEFQRFIRDEERVRSIYRRIKQSEEMCSRIQGLPEDYDTLKSVFGRSRLSHDIVAQEISYLREYPDSRYNTVVKRTNAFPDYIDYLPQGAIVRKIGIMAREDMSIKSEEEYIFFTREDYRRFIGDTCALVYSLLNR